MSAPKKTAQAKVSHDPRLNSRLRRHIKSLELHSVSGYFAWCKANGFAPSLAKNLQQLKAESTASEKGKVHQLRRQSLHAHLKDMGFADIAAYRRWCRINGLSDSVHKSLAQRQKEKRFRHEALFSSSLPAKKHQVRDIPQTLHLIASGRLKAHDITHPGFRYIRRLLTDMDRTTQKTFINMAAQVFQKSEFLDTNPVIDLFGAGKGNTYIDGLVAFCRHRHRWIRSVETWVPRSHSLRRRFGELARHLFARYDVPEFMDSVWFLGDRADALKQQGWFIHIGIGNNIRSADIPLKLTKAMAHLFLKAPKHYTVVQALRWGQIRALGGTPELVEHIIATRLGSNLENEDFWIDVINFFINNPMLDYDYTGPIVDYIYAQKFQQIEELDGQGRVVVAGPADPNFSMKGRKARPLLQLVDRWHSLLSSEKKSASAPWKASSIPPFEHLEEDRATGHILRWTIRELLSRREIVEEGKVMHHCVASYYPACAKGKKSVWSMQVEDVVTGSSERILTIAVKNDTKRVVQARGKCNVMPGPAASAQRKRIASHERELLNRGRALMRIWGRQVGVAVPLYT